MSGVLKGPMYVSQTNQTEASMNSRLQELQRQQVCADRFLPTLAKHCVGNQSTFGGVSCGIMMTGIESINFYCVNTSKIPGELSHVNMISSHGNNNFTRENNMLFSLRSLMLRCRVETLEDKIHIHGRACDILYTSFWRTRVFEWGFLV